MAFPSPAFLFLFLPLVLAFAWIRRWLPVGVGNAGLLLFSMLFYAWAEPGFVAIFTTSMLVNWGTGLCVGGRRGRVFLVAGITVNLSLLALFKYAGFVMGALNQLLDFAGWSHARLRDPGLFLPLGISFFTFQGISYLVDVYRRRAPPARSPIDVALYLALFPQLIAGPIVRFATFAPQLARRGLEGAHMFSSGVSHFVVGLAKKVLIADNLAPACDPLFMLPPDELGALAAWLGAVLYALQIYYDFSGYSDMAVGLGRMLGFELPENFRDPYVARSLTEFWRRWHMTLSSWFRDYLYLPLGGSRRGRTRTLVHLVLVFLLCGLWHGAGVNFVVWGAGHGLVLVCERAVGLGRRRELPPALGHLYTLIVVLVLWIPFRVAGLSDTIAYWQAMLGGGPKVGLTLWPASDLGRELLARAVFPIPMLAALIGVVFASKGVPWSWLELRKTAQGTNLGTALCPVLSVSGTIALLWLVFAAIAANGYAPFIYFRF